jgi:hypothetical protein
MAWNPRLSAFRALGEGTYTRSLRRVRFCFCLALSGLGECAAGTIDWDEIYNEAVGNEERRASNSSCILRAI